MARIAAAFGSPDRGMPSLLELRHAMSVLFEGLDRSMIRRLVAANALALVGGTLAGLAPVALKELVDAVSRRSGGTAVGTAAEPWTWIVGLGLFYPLCLGAGRLASELRPLLVGSVEQRLHAGLRVRYFAQLLRLPLSFHLARHSGELGHSLQQAVAGYQLILSSLVNGIVPVLVEAVTVGLVLLSLGQPALSACFALTGVSLALVVGRQMSGLRASAHAVAGCTVQVHGVMADGLINYEPIKCCGAERETIDRFRQRCLALEGHWQDLLHRRLAIGTSVTAVFTMSVASSLALALLAAWQGSLSLGGFVLATLYMVQIIRPLELLSSAARDVSQGLAFVRPLLEVLEIRTDAALPMPAAHRATDGHTAKPNAARGASFPSGVACSFRDVWLAYEGGPPVLRGVSIDIAPGRSLAIVGPSGCGKSSLIRLLLGLSKPDAGSVRVAGESIDAMPVDQLRALIAVVPQDLTLLNGTIATNIALGKGDATAASIAQAARLAGLSEFIAALPCGYETEIGERGLKLSGGERQRIAIARAILRNPHLLLLDEATSMLDARTEHEIMQNIRAIAAGRTLIMVAHRLSAIRHADEIAVLAGGRIVERADHATLLALGGQYAAMWRHQQAEQCQCGCHAGSLPETQPPGGIVNGTDAGG
jgi:ATP-binding cassette subfamily B protein